MDHSSKGSAVIFRSNKEVAMRKLRVCRTSFLLLFALSLMLEAPQVEARDCWTGMIPRDLGGGTWWDRNYVVEAPLNYLPSNYAIYYRTDPYGVWIRMWLSFHGVFNGRARWGVSTHWAYGQTFVTADGRWHARWLDSSRWSMWYRC